MGSKYALMVNSGSSANLLVTFAACNPMRNNKFKLVMKFLFRQYAGQHLCGPLVQAGLKPVFVDVDRDSLNVNSKLLIKKITKRTKVIMLVHVLGNSTEVDKITKIAKRKKLL